MGAIEQIAHSIVERAEGSWSVESLGDVAVLRANETTHRSFVPNITVFAGESDPPLYRPSTSVVLAHTEKSTGPTRAHQVVVDMSSPVAITHETIWLRVDDSIVVITASSAGSDVSATARLMSKCQATGFGRDET